MLIKQSALSSYLTRKLPEICILTGSDAFLLNEAANNIKQAWQQKNNEESEETILYLNSPSDWSLLNEEINSYSLFASTTLIDARYDKKTLEAAAKEFLTNYVKNPNPQSLLLIRAPNLTSKLLQTFVNHEAVCVVQITALTGMAMQNWIVSQLQKKAVQFEAQVPELIHLYTQGNMLACAQAIEKIELIQDRDTILTAEAVKEQLIDQCNYQLFELSDACLNADSNKAIQLLRHARNDKTEPTLVLWLLTQDLRLLIQLTDLAKQGVPFLTACSQLKIWSQRTRLYQATLKRASTEVLCQCLQFCKIIDERIKSSQSNQVWHALEQLGLSICLGKQVGFFA